MGRLYASDILWSQVAVPEIDDVLQDEQVEAQDLPAGNFMPEIDAPEWLDQTEIASLSLGGLSSQRRRRRVSTASASSRPRSAAPP